jgi:hypothetical protein
MPTDWKTNLRSALRRLEAAIPVEAGLVSVILYADHHDQFSNRGIMPLKLKGPNAILRSNALSRPIRKVAFFGDLDHFKAFDQHTIELAHALDNFKHPNIPDEWTASKLISGRLSNGLLQWLLALHQFARRGPDVELYDLNSSEELVPPGQVPVSQQWFPTGPYMSLVRQPMVVSAKFADWIINTEGIGQCPVKLIGEEYPPQVRGNAMKKPLTENQYAVIQELIKSFPDGLTIAELKKNTGITLPRYTLLDLMGDRRKTNTKTPEKKLWTEIILPPFNTGLGWRLKPV